MPKALYETRLQGIIIVVFSVAKSGACLVQYNYHDFLHARLIEGIEDCVWLPLFRSDVFFFFVVVV